MVAVSHPRCCGMRCPRITNLSQGRWEWHGPGLRTIWRWGQQWQIGARVRGFGGLWLWRGGGWILQFLRSTVLQFQRQTRPSGNDLAGQVLGTSLPWIIFLETNWCSCLYHVAERLARPRITPCRLMGKLLLRSCFLGYMLFCCFLSGLIMFQWCLSDVPVMLRWWRFGDVSPCFRNALFFSRLGVVSALFSCYFADVPKVFCWCSNHVSIMLLWCRDVVSVASRCLGDVAGCRVLRPWWCGGGTLLCWCFGRCRNDVWVTSRGFCGGIANVSVSLNCRCVGVPALLQ